jgi:hypothetical protein
LGVVVEMKRAKKRQFRKVYLWRRFDLKHLMTVRATPNDVTKYDGPLISGEIGTIDGFRIIET